MPALRINRSTGGRSAHNAHNAHCGVKPLAPAIVCGTDNAGPTLLFGGGCTIARGNVLLSPGEKQRPIVRVWGSFPAVYCRRATGSRAPQTSPATAPPQLPHIPPTITPPHNNRLPVPRLDCLDCFFAAQARGRSFRSQHLEETSWKLSRAISTKKII